MNPEYDIIIIGSGPAGVSAAFPLLKRGMKVLMLDGGFTSKDEYNSKNYLTHREFDGEQWKWMLGKDFHSLKMAEAVSPKLRVPALSYVFEKFSSENKIRNKNFVSVGSLSVGGLSNAWGAGVARFSKKELAEFPVPVEQWDAHYESVSARVGISGKSDDDLSQYFSVDAEAQNPISIDEVNNDFLEKYNSNINFFKKYSFKLGRSRVAVLSSDKGDRKACSLSGNCLWGCSNRSIYSAIEDLEQLKTYSNFRLLSGCIVKELVRTDGAWLALAESQSGEKSYKFSALKVILAAGTLATTRFALKLLPSFKGGLNLLSSPTAAFIAWNYRKFGVSRKPGFGLGQLSYTIDIDEKIKAFGSTFSTTGIPVAEFAKHVPLSRAVSIDVLSALLSSCVVGNIFLPGHLTKVSATLQDDHLHLDGVYAENVPAIMQAVLSKINRAFFKMGGLILPGSFKVGLPGADIHYAGSLPLSENPQLGQTSALGELVGAEGVYIADGACLPILPEKSHTLTIMANAERIGKAIADQHFS